MTHQNIKKLLLGAVHLLLFVSLTLNLSYADTNGIWHNASDIVPGIVAADENRGTFQFIDDVDITQTLDVTGSVTMGQTLAVTGNTNIFQNLNVSGDTNILQNLQISGNVGIGKSPTGFALDVAGWSNFNLTQSQVSYFGYLVDYDNNAVVDPSGTTDLTSLRLSGVDVNNVFVNEGQVDSITSTMIVDGVIQSSDIADNTITSQDIAPGTIDSSDINISQIQLRGSASYCSSNQSVIGIDINGNVVCQNNAIIGNSTINLTEIITNITIIQNKINPLVVNISFNNSLHFYITSGSVPNIFATDAEKSTLCNSDINRIPDKMYSPVTSELNYGWTFGPGVSYISTYGQGYENLSTYSSTSPPFFIHSTSFAICHQLLAGQKIGHLTQMACGSNPLKILCVENSIGSSSTNHANGSWTSVNAVSAQDPISQIRAMPGNLVPVMAPSGNFFMYGLGESRGSLSYVAGTWYVPSNHPVVSVHTKSMSNFAEGWVSVTANTGPSPIDQVTSMGLIPTTSPSGNNFMYQTGESSGSLSYVAGTWYVPSNHPVVAVYAYKP